MSTLVDAKRFYKAVGVSPVGEGWQVTLDGRAVKTPAGVPMVMPRRDLAEAVAREWDSQGERLVPDTLPLYRLIATAIDRVGPRRPEVVAITLKFAETDLLCYRATEPVELSRRQAERWQPLLDWARETLGADMRVTEGVIPVNQPAAALAALEHALDALDDLALAGISAATAASSSLVIAFALARGQIDAETAAEVALLDELFQTERWGEDAEAGRRRERIKGDIADTARFLELVVYRRQDAGGA